MSKSNNKGYGLHKERVIFGGSEIVRTIKYPLSPTTHDASFKNLQNLEKAIIDSDLKIFVNMGSKGLVQHLSRS